MPATVAVQVVYPGCFEVTINETGADGASEVEINGVPAVGTVARQTCVLESGLGATVQPTLLKTSGGTGIDVVVAIAPADAAAVVDRCGHATYRVAEMSTDPTKPGGKLYHASQVDAGSNNTIITTYHLTAGW